MISINNQDCLEGLVDIADNSIDLVITAPPYENAKNNSYYGDQWNFEKFCIVAQELFRVVKDGGIVVWVVGDATIDGSETCSSFKQVLKFVECGFKLHDTMIYEKANPIPQNHNRYEQCFEYMFVFSKGRPNTFNPIKENTKYYGKEMTWGNRKEQDRHIKVKETKNHKNIFRYSVGSNGFQSAFPYQLARDHIKTWSNIGDTVLDPFMGSGTTAIAAFHLNRNVIGFEIDTNSYAASLSRISHLNPIQDDLFEFSE